MSSSTRGFKKRGEIVKSESKDEIVMGRRLLVRTYELTWLKENCIGCGICVDMCPKEAIDYIPAEFRGCKRVSDRPRINFKPDDCVLCGECVVVCPMDKCLLMTIDGVERTPVLEQNAFVMVARKSSL